MLGYTRRHVANFVAVGCDSDLLPRLRKRANHARAGLDDILIIAPYNAQVFELHGRVNGAGLRFLPVIHEGNQSSCPEEAEKIRELVAEILNSKSTWIDREGKEATIEAVPFGCGRNCCRTCNKPFSLGVGLVTWQVSKRRLRAVK